MRRNCQPNNLCIFVANFCYFPTKFAPENCNFAANFTIFQPNLHLNTHPLLIAAEGCGCIELVCSIVPKLNKGGCSKRSRSIGQ